MGSLKRQAAKAERYGALRKSCAPGCAWYWQPHYADGCRAGSADGEIAALGTQIEQGASR